MYGTMEQSATNQQPLLPESNNRYQDGQIGSTFGPTPAGNRRDRMARAPSARNGPVLTLLMEKAHHQKHHSEPPAVSILELTEEHSNASRPKSFVYTMLNPRSDAWQAVAFKWFIAAVIVSVS
jgi:hypothetical protein